MTVKLNVAPINPTIGAVVSGIELAALSDDETVMAIRKLLLQHKVIFFEHQTMTPLQQRDFAARLGPLHVHPLYPKLAEVPELVVLDTGPHNPTDNDSWHSDATFLPNPIMATMLYARVIPPSGGDTLWSDMRAAYLALSAPLREFLLGLSATHDLQRAFPVDNSSSRSVGQHQYATAVADHPLVVHPVIRTHPETGEDCLFVNDGHTLRILELSSSESAAILEFLHQHIQAPEFTLRWKWKVDTVALWDNRVTQHYAVNDYLPHRRVMHRAMIVGDKPYLRARR